MSNKVPNGWKECKLGEVVYLNQRSIDSTYEYQNIVYLDTGSITRGRITDIKEYKLSEAPSRAKRPVKHNDIVYSTVRPVQRHYGIINNPPDNMVVSTGFVVIEAIESLVDPFFIYYFLTLDEIVEILDIIAEASTSAYPSLRPSDLENLNILLPPLPEQRAIASVLSSLDDKIDLLHRENKTLEAMAETLFRQWFIEEAKDDWEDTKLGEVVTITYGKNLPIKKLLGSGYPVFGGNGQIGFYNKYLYVEPQVLVSCRGEASGKVNISLPRSFITNNSLILVRDKRKEITFEYLKYHSLNYDFTLHVSGSAQPQITIDSLYDAAFLIPPVDLINKFTEIVRGYEEKRTNNLKQIHTLEKLRDTLLPKLMSGEVRIQY